MRVLATLSVLCIIFAGAYGESSDTFIGWHERVGIKQAQQIKYEENMRILNPIVGGAAAPVNHHPYLAGLLVDVIGLSLPTACGGSLLNANRVLTAAHCWFDGRFQAVRFTVVLGSQFLFHGGVRMQASAIAVHPRYDFRTFANDIAMLYLPTRVQFSSAIQPIALPHGSLINADYTGRWMTAAGYGRYSDLTTPSTDAMARNVFLEAISLDRCRKYYGNIVLDSNVCTSGIGGVGICQGDSGGPLTVNYMGKDVVVGVSSFVARDGCELGFPSAFARVSSYIDWIQVQL